jgi:hypothetical protein
LYKVGVHLLYIPPTVFSPAHFFSMARRSQRKKAISPETIAISDNDHEFMAVASNDQYVALYITFVCSTQQRFSFFITCNSVDKNMDEHKLMEEDHGKKNAKPTRKYSRFVPFIRKDSAPSLAVKSEEDDK